MRHLWPDPADENCPQVFCDTAARLINEFAKKVDNDMGLLEMPSGESKQRWAAVAKKPLQPAKKQDLCILADGAIGLHRRFCQLGQYHGQGVSGHKPDAHAGSP